MNNYLKISLAVVLLTGISAQALADNTSLSTSFNAKIVDNSCQILLSGGGSVDLGVVSLDYLKALTPTQYAGGTHFTISVNDCGQSDSRQASQLHMAFRPQSGEFASQTQQVFTNDTPVESQGAKDVGVAVFNDVSAENVLKTDGSSDLIFPSSGDSYQGDYSFTARMQQDGDNISPGQVTANVIVDVYYD